MELRLVNYILLRSSDIRANGMALGNDTAQP